MHTWRLLFDLQLLFAELVTVWTMGVRGCPINSAASKSADLLELVSA